MPNNRLPPHSMTLTTTGNRCIRALAFLPDGRVVIGTAGGTVSVFDIEDETPDELPIPHEDAIQQLAVTQDGTMIISSDVGGVVNVWDVASHTLVKQWAQPHRAIALSPNGRLLAVGLSTVYIFAIEDKWQVSQIIDVADEVVCMSFSPDSNKLAYSATRDRIHVYDLTNGSLVFGIIYSGYQQCMSSLLWSPCGFKLFSCSRGTIYWWNYEAGELCGYPWTGHAGAINSLCLSPHGSVIASVSSDHTVQLWDIFTAVPLGHPLKHDGSIDAVCFSPSSKVLASGGDGILNLWFFHPGGSYSWNVYVTYPRPTKPLGFDPEFPPPPNLTRRISGKKNRYIAGGGFGDVYRCLYSGKEVAVKAFRFSFALNGDANDKSQKMLRRELGIWRRLDHDNIVPFLGIAYGFGMHGAMSLVSLWMPHGSLHHFLEKYHDRLGLGHRLQFLLDIANGLDYLHSFPTPVIHGDLNGNNVLIDVRYRARLTDFGYASLVGNIPEALTYLQRSTTRPGALRWMAPEQITSEETCSRTTKSDIYSLGCVALQGSKQPWAETREDMAIVLRLAKGDKPDRPVCDTLQDPHWDFIQQCWSSPEERPPVKAIIPSIRQFLNYCQVSLPLFYVLASPSRHMDASIVLAFDTTKRHLQKENLLTSQLDLSTSMDQDWVQFLSGLLPRTRNGRANLNNQ